MGYSGITVFFPVLNSSLPARLESWLDVADLMNEYYKNPQESGFRSISSRNWAYQDALQQLCQSLEISGLQFLYSEVICLGVSDLQSDLSALDEILLSISDGFPTVAKNTEENNSLWWLQRDVVNGVTVEIPEDDIRKAFRAAKAEHDVSPKKDVGYEALVGFFSFIKSLREAINEAIQNEMNLLYVIPQP